MGLLTRQAGENSFQTSRDPKLGIVAATLLCHTLDYTDALFAPAPDIGIVIPEWNPRAVVEMPAGTGAGYAVTVSYEGLPVPMSDDGESFELEASTSEDPVESHWNYEVLLKNYKGTEDRQGHAKWPRTLTTKSAPKPRRNKMHGVESWAAPGLIWNRDFVKRDLPPSLVRELGTIVDRPPGRPPELTGNRDWLCIRIRARQRGNVWHLQQSWQMSGPDGAVPEMYQRT